jgi:ribonuclease VapC
MVVVDSSAIIAIFLNEPDSDIFIAAIEKNDCVIAVPTVLETIMVLSRTVGHNADERIYQFIDSTRFTLKAFDERHLRVAAHAFLRFGKGRHPAKLNYGDCMAYALAKSLGAPLLFKGNDFALTDIESVV